MIFLNFEQGWDDRLIVTNIEKIEVLDITTSNDQFTVRHMSRSDLNINLSRYQTLEEANEEIIEIFEALKRGDQYYRFKNTLLENRIMNKLTE